MSWDQVLHALSTGAIVVGRVTGLLSRPVNVLTCDRPHLLEKMLSSTLDFQEK